MQKVSSLRNQESTDNLSNALRNTAGDVFLGGLTTSLAAVILGLDIGTALFARLSDYTAGPDEGKRRVFLPGVDVKRRGVVVCAHGTTQHAGSYAKLAEHLNARGYIVIAVDLRGHGTHYHDEAKKPSERQVNYERSVRDLLKTFKKVKEDFPKLPVFCIGESVGAAVVAKAAGIKPTLVNGIVLCSSGARPYVFAPSLVVPDFVKGIFKLDQPMDVSRYINRYSSDDSRVTKEMIDDPLSRVSLTPRELVRTAFFLATTPNSAKKIDPSIPVLIVQGSIDNLVAKHGIRSIVKNLRSHSKDVFVLPGGGHILMGTSFLKDALVDRLVSWLDSQPAVASA